jgi:alkaline phosphatase
MKRIYLYIVTLGAILAAPAFAADGYGTQVYDQSGWVRYGMSTHPLNLSLTPTGAGLQDANLVYNPANAWNGYNWLMSTYTDSAAAATAMATGQKSYNNAINWSDFNTAITPTIVESFHNAGKATGTITSVEFSHATPAGMSNAHSVTRNDYAGIANQMLNGNCLDVIMGCGNPDYNDNGQPASMNAQYVGGANTWSQLKAGTHAGGWQLRQSYADFQALTAGNPTGRFLGVPQTYTTLQQARSGYSSSDTPYSVPQNQNVPTLELMTRGALNVLDSNEKGFFLHVEGGAVDWANHANQGARMIEEQIDFNNSVDAVVNWVETNSNWDETLLIVTADHECGLLWGADADTQAFDPIENRGAGVMPGLKFMSGNHANSLVPFYARGAGANLISALVDGNDSTAAAAWLYAHGWNGDYIDNTDVYALMNAGIAKNVILMISDGAGFNTFDAASMYQGRWIPEPASLSLLLIGALALRRR